MYIFRRNLPVWLPGTLLLLLSCNLMATADGPDHYAASDITGGNVLNIHDNPDTRATVLGIIPPDATCIRNLGCRGGLSIKDFTTLSEQERTRHLRENPRWCKIGYQGITGWVTGRNLVEDYCTRETTADGFPPGFDCNRADGTVEELVCRDAALAQLDRYMNGVYAAALARHRLENYQDPRPEQRGWIKGRNDCWKADDINACISAAYRQRIAELQVRYGQLEVPAPVYFDCGSSSLTAVFYPQTLPPTLVLTITPEIQDVSQVLAYQELSASGVKYRGRNVTFWEHQGEARLEWRDKKMKCTVAD